MTNSDEKGTLSGRPVILKIGGSLIAPNDR